MSIFKYRVVQPRNESVTSWDAMIDWVHKMTKPGDWSWYAKDDALVFTFKNRIDAVMFKLMYG